MEALFMLFINVLAGIGWVFLFIFNIIRWVVSTLWEVATAIVDAGIVLFFIVYTIVTALHAVLTSIGSSLASIPAEVWVLLVMCLLGLSVYGFLSGVIKDIIGKFTTGGGKNKDKTND